MQRVGGTVRHMDMRPVLLVTITVMIAGCSSAAPTPPQADVTVVVEVGATGANPFTSPVAIAKAAGSQQCTSYSLTPPASQGGFSTEVQLRLPEARATGVAKLIKGLAGVFSVRTAPLDAYAAAPAGRTAYAGPKPCGAR